MRIGHGFDVHPLVAGRKLVIGGVEISHDKGLLGNSDADVLLHAIADALLGAVGLPDIGQQFPPSDERYLGADSLKLLDNVVQMVHKAGFPVIHNVDAVIMAEAPKMNPHIPAMKKNIARARGIDPSCVGLKATTTEKLGFVGREEGIAASAVCLLDTNG
jgi:2-C-methyl-D-erythritol 2,4-cyclodiphosphate synthase